MTGGIISLIGSILALILVCVKAYLESKPERQERAREEEIQRGRQDIVSGNVDAVSERINKLLSKSSDNTAGS